MPEGLLQPNHPTFIVDSTPHKLSRYFIQRAILPGGQETFNTVSDFKDLSKSNPVVCFKGECSWASPFYIRVCFKQQDSAFPNIADGANAAKDHHHSTCLSQQPRIGAPTTSPDESLEKLRIWLNNCTNDHKYCLQSINPVFFPTRVIDTQNIENGTVNLRDKTRICTEKTFSSYWTLSHRWGDPAKVLQLYKGNTKTGTISNEKHFRNGIGLHEISPTFRDAVQLVHKMGYRYIWIDSLCIFQDSPSDWEVEASLMNDVYGNSFCNISAIRSSYDASLGLFGQRIVDPRTFESFSVDAEFPVDGNRRLENCRISYNSLFTNDVNNSPLSSRGWVVQERFLARRIIHFTRTQLYWECLEVTRCEEDPDNQRGLMETDEQTKEYREMREYKATLRKIIREVDFKEFGASREGGTPFRIPWPTPRECWRLMVQTYSSCDLTQRGDILIAILGVAKRFDEFHPNDKYMMGLWKEALHTDLTWESNASEGAPVKRDTSLAPSWSWASLTGGKITVPAARQVYGGEAASHIEFVDARAEPGHSDNILEIDIKATFYFFRKRDNSEEYDFFADEAMSRHAFCGIVDIKFDTGEIVLAHRKAGYKGICISAHSGYQGHGMFHVVFLIIKHVSGSTYRRIGKLSRSGTGWSTGNDKVLITLV
ncbi:unnamed protein product, partial [Fusarium graminearum]